MNRNKFRMLNEMGLGPLWLLRQPAGSHAVATSTQAEIMSSSHSPAAAAVAEMPEFAAMVSAETIPHMTPQPQPADTVAHAPVAEMNWPALQESVAHCRACGLCEGRNKTVFGVGDPRATWLFVGEGPGYNENIKGEPFVGAAGQLLDNMLTALGLRRGERAYIANVVKCRPTDPAGKDRPPTAEEIQACLPYLKRQIALIQPEVIVALGKTAAIALLQADPETPVAQLRGRVHSVGRVPMIVTYHPAYLLRKPLDKSKAWTDLCLAQSTLHVAAS
ncbi:uracil-DNA glycosylase [Undibacterium oligocarboniphilum]|uniref:Type-4 uracil-DNA glycosylase n=1 Tax=Undibacterium oligocarboniphilum TaxID=666702 RepID=A0A850QHZ3_9BURK|nr:uracil-DNA glycosylase [Undibacterium oligocarboniphilum]MBC3871225.1 uracil-DNA glycosylase [Undibacterium oligocarboniphilum]NVO79201.1 uracil-DNA glycosylase [Undibacterium oligocarboniphilum]